MSVDFHRYYDLETYLFEDVRKRFVDQGSIGAFDLFSIVIWKANRAKSLTARRLHKSAMPRETLDALCHRLSSEVHRAASDEERFRVLVEHWGFALPMASAILTVLYPETFTVYDFRVCAVLGEKEFARLANLTHPARLWAGYCRFLAAVRAASTQALLRNKDRELTGRSIASQLERDIETWFE